MHECRATKEGEGGSEGEVKGHGMEKMGIKASRVKDPKIKTDFARKETMPAHRGTTGLSHGVWNAQGLSAGAIFLSEDRLADLLALKLARPRTYPYTNK